MIDNSGKLVLNVPYGLTGTNKDHLNRWLVPFRFESPDEAFAS